LIPRVYIDTSVVGGYFDEEFSEHSQRLFCEFTLGRLQAVLSSVTIEEVERSPARVRALLHQPPLIHAERVSLNDEAITLAEEYVHEGIVTASHRVDARHIAIATICRVDVLVSWNFEHVVKLYRIRAFNSVNLRLGYPQLEIRSPREVCHEET